MAETAQPIPTLEIETAEIFEPLLADGLRYLGAHGGRGSGKSWFFADRAIERTAFEPLRVLCIREFQRTLEQSVKFLLEQRIKINGLQKYFKIYERKIEGRCGSLFTFEGMQAHNADSIRSFEGYDIAWFEEAQNASQRSLDLLRPTIRKPGSQLWFSWNPQNPTDPIDAFLRSSELPPQSAVVCCNWWDNPWFPEELRRDMEYDRSRDPDKYAHVWAGEYLTHSEAKVFRNWRIAEFSPTEFDDIDGPYQGADWGFATDPTVFVRVWVRQQARQLLIEHEAWKIGCKLTDTEELFEKVPNAKEYRVKADSARPETIDFMRDKGWPIHGAKKGAGSVVEGIEFIKDYDVIIHPRCRHVIDEFTSFSYQVDRLTGKPTNKLSDKKNHTIDSVRYALEDVRSAVHDFW